MNDNIHNLLAELRQSYSEFTGLLHSLEMETDTRNTGKLYFGPEVITQHMVGATRQVTFLGPKLDDALAEFKLALKRVRNDEISNSILEGKMAYHQRLQAQADFYEMVLRIGGQAYRDMTGNAWKMPDWARPKKTTPSQSKKAKEAKTASEFEAQQYLKALGVDPEEGVSDIDAIDARTDGVSTSDDEALERQAS